LPLTLNLRENNKHIKQAKSICGQSVDEQMAVPNKQAKT